MILNNLNVYLGIIDGKKIFLKCKCNGHKFTDKYIKSTGKQKTQISFNIVEYKIIEKKIK